MIHLRHVRRFIPILIIIMTLTIFSAPIAAQSSPVTPPWRFDFRWATQHAEISVGDTLLEVEIADTAFLSSRGLSYRDGLRPGTGMLFTFSQPSILAFWMKDMRFCLDIIWIENGEIVGAAEHVCPEPGASDAELTRYESPQPVTYVLEVPADWLADHGYGVGTKVTFGPIESR